MNARGSRNWCSNSNNFTGPTCTHMLLDNFMQTHVNQFSCRTTDLMNNYLLDVLLTIGDNLLNEYLCRCCFLIWFCFPNWCTDPPKIVKFKTEYFVGVQERVTLKCEAEGNPSSTYIWIPCDTEQVCDKNALHISQVLSDTNYTCRVANVYGNDSKTANVCKSQVHCSHALNNCIFIHVPTWHFDWVDCTGVSRGKNYSWDSWQGAGKEKLYLGGFCFCFFVFMSL